MSRELIPSTLTLIEGPALEPLDLDQVKKHLRFGPTTEDTLLDGWISAARQYFEEQTGRQVMRATWELATYTVMAPSGPQAAPGWVQLGYGGTWPTVQAVSGSVRVRFQAGYGSTPGDVPELVRTMLYLLVGQFHKYRSETVETRFESALSSLPLGVDQIMRGFKYTALPKFPPRTTMVTA